MQTLEQMIDFHRGQAEKCLANTRSPAIRENPFLFALNHQLAHQSALAVGLLQWRFSLADPRPYLRKAYDICCAATQVLPGLSFAEPLVSRFRFYDGVHLAVLLEEKVGADICDVLEKSRLSADIHTALDCALGLAIATNQPSLLGAALAQHDFPRRLKLYQRTYDSYQRLLSGDSSVVASAEDNYRNRARDNYYSEGFLIDVEGPTMLLRWIIDWLQ